MHWLAQNVESVDLLIPFSESCRNKTTFSSDPQKDLQGTFNQNYLASPPQDHPFLLSVLLPNIMHFYRRRTPRRNRKSPIRPILLMIPESAFPMQEGLPSLGTDLQSTKSQDVSQGSEQEMKNPRSTYLIRNTPTAFLLDELILKRRPRRQRHGNEPPRILALVIDRGEWNRVCRVPATELGDRAGEKDRLAECGTFGDVEGYSDGRDCGAGW